MEYEKLLTWMTGLSLLIFLAGLAITPFLIAAIPDDYFENRKRPKSTYPPFSAAWLIKKAFKNILGITLFISGIAMLLLPGQGLLTLMIGLFLMDYPGKYRLEKKLLSYPLILNSINWLRRKRNKNLFKLPPSN
ncbi:hypothetical protein N9F42_02885 [Pseudomonadales bacterium]|nr:hypothetical protein [Pseudomonadales bacterium]